MSSKLPHRPKDFSPIREALGRGEPVADTVFDDIFPLHARRASSLHWTPVEIAVRAATLLAEKPGAVILDIGAGIGKFCIVAAATVDAEVRGVEHRPHLVDVGRSAAEKLGVTIRLDEGTLADEDPLLVDGVYLFNPFAENLCAREDRLDETVELSEARFWRDVRETERFLRDARPGTRLVTYCGSGGGIPDDYRRAVRERRGGTLELWIKTVGYSREREGHAEPSDARRPSP